MPMQSQIIETPKIQDDPQAPQEKTPAPQKKASTKQSEFTDTDVVTVLYGYGKIAANHSSYVDNILFTGGVARNVPYVTAKHWKAGTRPDGKPAISRIFIQAILPNDATQADFAKITGIQQAIQPEYLGAILNGLNATEMLEALGPDQAKELLQRLQALVQK